MEDGSHHRPTPPIPSNSVPIFCLFNLIDSKPLLPTLFFLRTSFPIFFLGCPCSVMNNRCSRNFPDMRVLVFFVPFKCAPSLWIWKSKVGSVVVRGVSEALLCLSAYAYLFLSHSCGSHKSIFFGLLFQFQGFLFQEQNFIPDSLEVFFPFQKGLWNDRHHA